MKLTSCLFLVVTLSALADATKDFEIRKDIDYAGTKNPRQALDLFLPLKKADKPRPLLVYIHGGGWEGGSKNEAGVLPHKR